MKLVDYCIYRLHEYVILTKSFKFIYRLNENVIFIDKIFQVFKFKNIFDDSISY